MSFPSEPAVQMFTEYTVACPYRDWEENWVYQPYSTNGKSAGIMTSLDDASSWAFNNGNFRYRDNPLVVLVRERTQTTYPVNTEAGELSPRVVSDASGWKWVRDAAPNQFLKGETWLVRVFPERDVEVTLEDDYTFPHEVRFPIRKVS